MPILKVNKDGKWIDIATSYEHKHLIADIDNLSDNIEERVGALESKLNGLSGDTNNKISVAQRIDDTVQGMFETLAEVARTGSYNDLTDVPTIPEQVQADWNQTDDTQADYIKNKPEGIATETYVQEEISKVDVSDQLEGLATKEELSAYALKTEIPSIEGLASKTYVQQQIDAIPEVDLTGYATETYVQNEIAKANLGGGDGEGDGSAVFVQSDWNQNDETQIDFIRNKPFGVEKTKEVEKVILPEMTFTSGYNSFYGFIGSTDKKADLVIGNTYRVMWNTEEFLCEAMDASSVMEGAVYIGNGTDFMLDGNNEPFAIAVNEDGTLILCLEDNANQQAAEHIVSITTTVTETYETQLDNKYLSILNYVPATETEIDLLPSTTYSPFTYFDDFGVHGMQIDEAPFLPNLGETYIVYWDGGVYECVAQDAASALGVKVAVGLGNGTNYGLSGKGEPFVIVIAPTYNMTLLGALNDTAEGGSHDVRIYKIQNTEECYQVKEEHLPILDYVSPLIDNKVGMMSIIDNPDKIELVVGKTYTVIWDGIEYKCEAVLADGMVGLGNLPMMMGGTEDTGHPFVIGCDPDGLLLGVPCWMVASVEAKMGTSTKTEFTCKLIDEEAREYKLKAGMVSWDDLTNRPFGEKIAKVELVPATDVTFEYDISNNFYKAILSVSPELWQSNWVTAKVTYGDTVYDCTVTILEDMKYFGNFGKFTGQAADNGMPFVCYAPVDNTNGTAAIHDYSNEPTILIANGTSLSVTSVDSYYTHEFSSVLSFTKGLEYHISLLNSNSSYINSNKKSTAMSYTSDNGTYVGIGNPSILGLGDDNSEKYFIFTKTATDGTQTSSLIVTTLQGSSTFAVKASLAQASDVTHNISISIDQEVIVPLDSKYLPADLSGLPEVTVDDNGKVMTVVDGVWTTASGLPEVTDNDDNKVLKVSGGVWTVDTALPAVTSTDNDKILTVVNGVWSAQTPASGLPEVSTSDAGKFLRVSSAGIWVVEAIPNAEEASF